MEGGFVLRKFFFFIFFLFIGIGGVSFADEDVLSVDNVTFDKSLLKELPSDFALCKVNDGRLVCAGANGKTTVCEPSEDCTQEINEMLKNSEYNDFTAGVGKDDNKSK
jgi:hypothetical protein